MSRPPSQSLPLLARALDAHLDADAVLVLVLGDGAAFLAAALATAGRNCRCGDAGADAVFDAAIVVTDGGDAHLEVLADRVLQRVRPGGQVLWAVDPPRSARRARALLRLESGDASSAGSARQVEDLLARAGAVTQALGAIGAPPDAALDAVCATVRAAGGDGDGLARDWAVSHDLLQARVPRRRAPRADASAEAVRTAVASAVAVGAVVGTAGQTGGAREADAGRPAAGRAPRVSIVIPVCNGAELTEKCLYAVAAHTGEDGTEYEVLVVDNGSRDWTMYLLHAMEGDLRVLSNDRNLGFARACNQGAAVAAGDYLLFLNNDTVPHDGWLAPMVALADADPTVGVVGARLLYPDGTVQHAGLHMAGGIPDHVHRGVAGDDPRVLETRDLDMVTGACLLVRRDLFDALGGFDTQFVNGVEDVDLCLRARERGFRVVYCADAVVDHCEAQTAGRFDHAQENLRRFQSRWGGRFDAAGRLRTAGPASAAGAGTAPVAARNGAVFRVNWEGSFFLHSSLAHVNRELVLALLASGRCELGLLPYEPDQFGPDEDPARFGAIAARMGHPLPDAAAHVRHRWPPDLSRPDGGRHVLMQPWEFGSIPRAWRDAVTGGAVDLVWAYTRYVRDCYVAGGVDPDRVAIVPLGVDPERFRPGLPAHEVVRTEKGFRFLFVGGTLYRKGIDLLLAAWRDAFGPQDDVCLVIKDMGVGTFYRNQTAGESVRRLQADPGCAEILYLTGDLPGRDMPRLYAAGNALVHPYRGEGFGLPVAEAMACGLPVVLTRGGACDDFCPEGIGYGVTSRRQPLQLAGQDTVAQAWQLAPDVESLKAQMRAVYENREEAMRRGLAGSDHVRTRVTWQAAAAAALTALEQLRGLPLTAPLRAAVGGGGTAPAARTAVVVLADRSGATTADTQDALGQGLGRHHRFAIDTASGHHLGEQLEAVRRRAVQEGAVFLLVLGGDVEVSRHDVRRLLAHLEQTADLALAVPARGVDDGGPALADVDDPGASCLLFRLEALNAVGGFDASFASTAVFANAARALRRKDWRIAAAADVVFEDGAGARLLPFHGDDLGQREAMAVTALERGDRRRDAGALAEAIEAYRAALGAKPDFVEAILVLADAQLEGDQGPAAVATVARLVDMDPESASAHNYAGLIAARAGDVGGARDRLRRAIDLDPGLVAARVNLGVVEWEQRDAEAALAQFREANRLDPYNRDLVSNLGLIYGQLDDDEAALQLFRAYLVRVPDDVEILGRLAEVLARRGEAVAAVDVARRLLLQVPDHVGARAILRQHRGEDDAAQS